MGVRKKTTTREGKGRFPVGQRKMVLLDGLFEDSRRARGGSRACSGSYGGSIQKRGERKKGGGVENGGFAGGWGVREGELRLAVKG